LENNVERGAHAHEDESMPPDYALCRFATSSRARFWRNAKKFFLARKPLGDIHLGRTSLKKSRPFALGK
jgi:hypothetical protein